MLVPTVKRADSDGAPRRLAVLGSTGSIGRQTLDVVEQHPDRFEIVALAAASNASLLSQQVRRHRPELVVLDKNGDDADPVLADALSGIGGLIAAATLPSVDIVVVATSGHAAILPTAEAIKAGKVIALANKETIVCAGELIARLAEEYNADIRPVDSEHSAIWQALGRSTGSDIERLILTASGGPFRDTSAADLAGVTVHQALAHPTWNMGGKITIDSATMMNKGLELIEAHWLFGTAYERLDVVVHPESIVHSLVEFADGSQIAQLSLPDMRLPIQYALTYPLHEPGSFKRLELAQIGGMHFADPDVLRFPALRLARAAGIAGNSYPTVLSAADEVAVAAFLVGKIGFMEICAIVERTLDAHDAWPIVDFEAVHAADGWAREHAAALVERAS